MSVSPPKQDVYKELVSLDPSKAKRVDNIGPCVLKFCALGLYKPIYHIFKLSLSRQELPKDWRTHCIIPIFKSGDKTFVTNYRPISLLCNVSKVLERIIYDRVVDHVMLSIPMSQFGFVKGRSTVQQLLAVFHDIYSAVDLRLEVDTIYFDIRKAFDSQTETHWILRGPTKLVLLVSPWSQSICTYQLSLI